jgi:ribose 5-phosphate isomerase B
MTRVVDGNLVKVLAWYDNEMGYTHTLVEHVLKQNSLTMKVYLAADHGGFELKSKLLVYLRDELSYEVEDCGAAIYDVADDYPPIIARAAKKLSDDVAMGLDSRAIIAGASGQGEAIVANRFKGVRCALYYGEAGIQTDAKGRKLDMIQSMREHNNANALSLGGRFITEQEAKDAVKKFLETPFPKEDRHMRRVALIDEVA